jgi:hypothetical protein
LRDPSLPGRRSSAVWPSLAEWVAPAPVKTCKPSTASTGERPARSAGAYRSFRRCS